MLIAVNTRFLLKDKLEGFGRFSYEILKRITQSHPEHQFIFFFDRKHNPEFIFGTNVTPVELFPQARHPFLFYWWFEFSVAKALKKYKPDLFFSPDGYLCLDTDVPSVAVFHDLAFIHYPQGISFIEKAYYNYFFPKFAKKADKIIAVSGFTKSDIVKQYQINPDKIEVVYNAAATGFVPVDEKKKKLVRDKFSIGCEYFLYVGALHPRKNMETLLKAFDLYKKNHSSKIKLLIVGRKAWQSKSIEDAYNNMQHKDETIFTGRVSDQDLFDITAAANCLVYIPYFEGFGLPLVEAMNCDVPVITSNVSSLPEVAGNAAILVNPQSVEQTADAMHLITSDEIVRNKMISEARNRKTYFNWDRSADKLWNCLTEVVSKQK